MQRRRRPTQSGSEEAGAGVFAHDLHLSVAGKQLLTGASLAVPAGRRVALIGRNGSGKSTLLETIRHLAESGAPPPHVELRGGLELGPGTRPAWLPQSPQLTFQGAVAAYLDTCAGEVSQAWNAHERLSRDLSTGSDERLLARYGEALEAMQRLGAWDYPARRLQVLAGLGLDPGMLNRPIGGLSGGEATRVALAGVLLSPANLVLLDEPSNNLDLAGVRFLTSWARSTPAALLLVSHDRDFLDDTVEEILEIEERTGTLRHYGGNFSFYSARKAEEFSSQLRAFEQQEGRRARLEESRRQLAGSADRFQSASQNDFYRARGAKVARLAKSQAVRIERELGELKEPKPHLEVRFTVLPPLPGGGTLLRARGLRAASLLWDLDLSIGAGERVAVVGPSGAGKTTLVRLLVGELGPAAGEVLRATGVRLAYLRQVQPPLEQGDSLLDHALRLHPANRDELRTILGKVVFTDAGRLRAGQVSEGERRRAECAALFASQPDVVLLDEPTNHLDLATIEMLEDALQEYKGTVVAVSHDRRFLRRLRATTGVVFRGTGEVDVAELRSEHELEGLMGG